MARKLKYVGRKGSKQRHVVGWFTKGTTYDGGEFFLGAPTKKKLGGLWRQLTAGKIDWSKVKKCRVYRAV